MYFLILTPELSVFFSHLVCYTVSLKTFPGTSPALVQAAPSLTVLYTVCLILCVSIL